MYKGKGHPLTGHKFQRGVVGEASGSCSSGHVFSDVIPCRLVNRYRRFEEVSCLHLRV